MEERNSFIFYKSFYDSAQYLTDVKKRLEWLEGIIDFALNSIEPVFNDDSLKLAWFNVKPILLRNKKLYENGTKGGRPKENQTITKDKPNNNQENEDTKSYPQNSLVLSTDNQTITKPIIETRTITRTQDEQLVNYINTINATDRKPFLKYYSSFFETYEGYKGEEWLNLGYELIDFLAALNKFAFVPEGLTFNKVIYQGKKITDLILNIDINRFFKIVATLDNPSKPIENRPWYILGIVINLGKESGVI